MLKTLTIKNYALIEGIEIAFEPGLNIITGETGAGKSIAIAGSSANAAAPQSIQQARARHGRSLHRSQITI